MAAIRKSWISMRHNLRHRARLYPYRVDHAKDLSERSCRFLRGSGVRSCIITFWEKTGDVHEILTFDG